jgi:hypothetical protein
LRIENHGGSVYRPGKWAASGFVDPANVPLQARRR